MSNELPRGWVTPAATEGLWGEDGTYGLVPYEALPPLPPITGSFFEWLRRAPTPEDPLTIMDDPAAQRVADFGPRLDQLMREAGAIGLTVPPELRTFMTSAAIHGRVPTCTACYLELGSRLIEIPEGVPGRLLRFMNDQQCCVVWYVHLRSDGGHAVVCGAPDWIEDAEGESLEDVTNPTELMTCASSFEEFVHRFWLENTLWYALRDGRELSPGEREYVAAAHRSRPSC